MRRMGRILGLLGLVIALAIGVYLYTRQAQSASGVAGAGSPKAAIDVTGVKNDLLAFANAEKQNYALEGKYLSLDELRAKGTAIPAERRGPYTYAAEIGDSGFRVVATFSGDPIPGAPRSLSISETMEIRIEN